MSGIAEYHGAEVLEERLRQVDGSSYGEYCRICGDYGLDRCVLRIRRTQRDPFAPPTLLQILVPIETAGFEAADVVNGSRRIALCDFLTRGLAQCLSRIGEARLGSGNSGKVEVAVPGQEIVERSSVQVKDGWIEARVYVGLPAKGRRILGWEARVLLMEVVRAATEGLLADHLDADALRHHLDVSEDQDILRSRLDELGLVSFVGNGAILPRAAGNLDMPMDGSTAVRFESPAVLSMDVSLPHSGTVRGMGVPKGVTLITGGGYHGKSTLLRAIERGVYNHIPGDGRERVVTQGDAVKVRAEEGRRINQVDLRPFIDQLPGGLDAGSFSTTDASGSTSQAAGIVESISGGSTVLLMDEDTSASNFLVRDQAMTQLVQNSSEPIRPYVRFVSSLADSGVSTVMAVGGTGAYFAKADCVLRMTEYRAECVTEEAHQIATRMGQDVEDEAVEMIRGKSQGIPKSWIERTERPRVRTGKARLTIGSEEIDVAGLEQLCAPGQIEGLGEILMSIAEQIDGRQSMGELVEAVLDQLDAAGMDVISDRVAGRTARPRKQEILAALNRARGLSMG